MVSTKHNNLKLYIRIILIHISLLWCTKCFKM